MGQGGCHDFNHNGKLVDKQQLWETVNEKICWEETNRPPITLKWVDRNKGDEAHPNYRSRLVVREVNRASKPLAEFESFSAMPPLEALKVLCFLITSKRTSTRGKPYKMMLIDISRAHFCGLAKRRVFCPLPEGHEQVGKCALLRKSMYGTLDAARVLPEAVARWTSILEFVVTDRRWKFHHLWIDITWICLNIL